MLHPCWWLSTKIRLFSPTCLAYLAQQHQALLPGGGGDAFPAFPTFFHPSSGGTYRSHLQMLLPPHFQPSHVLCSPMHQLHLPGLAALPLLQGRQGVVPPQWSWHKYCCMAHKGPARQDSRWWTEIHHCCQMNRGVALPTVIPAEGPLHGPQRASTDRDQPLPEDRQKGGLAHHSPPTATAALPQRRTRHK